MSYKHKHGFNNINGSGIDALFIPRGGNIRTGKPGLILCHGAGQGNLPGNEMFGAAFPDLHKMIAVATAYGIPVVTGNMGGNNFGNDVMSGSAGTAYVNAALAYMAAQTGASATRAHVFGVSMGHTAAVRWGSLNAAKAASISALMPADPDLIYRTNGWAIGLAGSLSYTSIIANAWGLANRSITDGVLNSGSNVITSATANFTAADVGRVIVRPGTQTQLPVDTTIVSVTNSTTAVLSKNATASGTGLSFTIAAPFPLSGDSGCDIKGYHAGKLLANSIPNRLYYSTADPLVVGSDVVAEAANSGGEAIQVSTSAVHDNTQFAAMAAHAGTDFADYIAWLLDND